MSLRCITVNEAAIGHATYHDDAVTPCWQMSAVQYKFGIQLSPCFMPLFNILLINQKQSHDPTATDKYLIPIIIFLVVKVDTHVGFLVFDFSSELSARINALNISITISSGTQFGIYVL